MNIINLEITSHDENLQLELSATIEGGQRFSTFLPMPQRVDDLATVMRLAASQLRNAILDETQK